MSILNLVRLASLSLLLLSVILFYIGDTKPFSIVYIEQVPKLPTGATVGEGEVHYYGHYIAEGRIVKVCGKKIWYEIKVLKPDCDRRGCVICYKFVIYYSLDGKNWYRESYGPWFERNVRPGYTFTKVLEVEKPFTYCTVELYTMFYDEKIGRKRTILDDVDLYPIPQGYIYFWNNVNKSWIKVKFYEYKDILLTNLSLPMKIQITWYPHYVKEYYDEPTKTVSHVEAGVKYVSILISGENYFKNYTLKVDRVVLDVTVIFPKEGKYLLNVVAKGYGWDYVTNNYTIFVTTSQSNQLLPMVVTDYNVIKYIFTSICILTSVLIFTYPLASLPLSLLLLSLTTVIHYDERVGVAVLLLIPLTIIIMLILRKRLLL